MMPRMLPKGSITDAPMKPCAEVARRLVRSAPIAISRSSVAGDVVDVPVTIRRPAGSRLDSAVAAELAE